jgi:hypothetical protein
MILNMKNFKIRKIEEIHYERKAMKFKKIYKIGSYKFMFKKYRNKINQIDPEKNTIYFILGVLIGLVNLKYESIALGILDMVLFFVFISKITKPDDRLKKAEEKTEFIHEGKIYNIKTSKLIFKNELDGHNGMLYTILYQSAKKNYFLYIMSQNDYSPKYKVDINTLDIERAKSWLLEKNVERYKEIFGEIEEA